MNKERCNQIIDKVYGKYADSHEYFVDGWVHVIPMEYSKEMFVNECKKNPEFSEKWGLKIEERDLSLLERREIARIKLNRKEWTDVLFLAHYKETYDKYNIPTRIITLSYNNKTATSYE